MKCIMKQVFYNTTFEISFSENIQDFSK